MSLNKLPEQIPLFPLTGASLLPKGKLPLNIFEPRYAEMVEMAHENDSIIGMIQPQGSRISSDQENNDLFGTAKKGRGLYSVGCAGFITKMEKTADGRYFIILTGLRRFEIIEELPLKNSFREVRVSYANYKYDGDDILTHSSKTKNRLYDSLKKYLNQNNINIDMKNFEDLDDEELINSLAMICPFEAAEKQLLIEIPTLDQRAELLLKIIDFNLAQHNISSGNNIH